MDGPLYMDAVITPHRSLSKRGLIVLISILTLINATTATAFVVLGAGPVPIFLALDVIALIGAFLISRRATASTERIQVSAREVRVSLETSRGATVMWSSPTAFTRVALHGEAEDATDLRLRLSNREVAVAGALSRGERLNFCQALDRAIMRARAGALPA
ncbi:MAG TPA: DUF2244 domain-containing protein [Caulobacteraceae bacterium]